MQSNNLFMGSLTDSYTATAPNLPPLGTKFIDNANGKAYVFLKNGEASSAISAGICTYADAASRLLNKVKITPNAGNDLFVGTRVSGASDVLAGECGWFQVDGEGYFILGPDGTISATDTDIITVASGKTLQVSSTAFNGYSGFSGTRSAIAKSTTTQATAGSGFSARIIRSIYK